MGLCYKKNWKTLFCMAVLIACFTSSVQSAARKASQYSPSDKASEAVKEVVPAAEKAAKAVKEVAPAAEKAVDAVKEVAPAAEKAAEVVKEVAPAAEKAAEVVKEVAPAAEKAAEVVKEVAPAAEKAAEVVKEVAPTVEKAVEAVKEAVPAAEKAVEADEGPSFQGMFQSREVILENQKAFFKDYDLDKLLQRIRIVLEHNDLKNVEKQFHQLFDKKDSSVYSCAFESAALDENLQIAKEEKVQEQSTKEVQDSVANAKSYEHESRLQEIYGHVQKTGENLNEEHKDAKETGERLKESRLEKTHEQAENLEPHQGEDSSLLSAKALYKKGYNLLLSANYVDAEKAFCTFQQHYKKDPLSDDALFWLAEALLGQKRYHEAAQVYLNAWYTDKKQLYTSEILLKLAMSMVALEQNKEACTFAAKKTKRDETLESIFCKPVKRSGVGHGGH